MDKILTCLFATYTGILTSLQSTSPYGLTSMNTERSPTTSYDIHSFGVRFEPRYIFRAASLDQ